MLYLKKRNNAECIPTTQRKIIKQIKASFKNKKKKYKSTLKLLRKNLTEKELYNEINSHPEKYCLSAIQVDKYPIF